MELSWSEKSEYIGIVGRRGENETRILTFDCTSALQEYPEAEILCIMQRPGDTQPYTHDYTQDGNTITVALASADMCRVGTVKLELRLMQGEKILKSAIYRGGIALSLHYGEPECGEAVDLLNRIDKTLKDATETAARLETSLDGVDDAIDRLDAATDSATATDKQAQENEKTRGEAEKERVEAENGRILSENSRQQQENERDDAEFIRSKNERSRYGNENQRIINESERTQAENARKTAESSRVASENTRVQAESERVKAETSRAEAEQSRIASEETRVSAEKSRTKAETLRVQEEQGRVTAEQGRVEAETKREETMAQHAEKIAKLEAEVVKKAEIDDTTVSDTNPWSSAHIIDVLCPKADVSGNPVVVKDALGGMGLTKCKASFTPTQAGTGTPSPDNIRPISGRNSVKVERQEDAQTTALTLPRTIYGGEVDAQTGEGQETWAIDTKSASDWRESSDGTDFVCAAPYTNMNNDKAYSNMFDSLKLRHNGSYYRISKKDTGFATIDDLRKAIGAAPVQIAYKLATPVPFTATGSAEIKALDGVNTLLTDGDTISATYTQSPAILLKSLQAQASTQAASTAALERAVTDI